MSSRNLIFISAKLSKVMKCKFGYPIARTKIIVFVCEFISKYNFCLLDGVKYGNNEEYLNLFNIKDPSHLSYAKIMFYVERNHVIYKDKMNNISLTITKFLKNRRFIKFIRRCVLKNRIKIEIELLPDIGIKYFEALERFKKHTY
jgi:hypothetical protein